MITSADILCWIKTTQI